MDDLVGTLEKEKLVLLSFPPEWSSKLLMQDERTRLPEYFDYRVLKQTPEAVQSIYILSNVNLLSVS